jgi:hypothetical protein
MGLGSTRFACLRAAVFAVCVLRAAHKLNAIACSSDVLWVVGESTKSDSTRYTCLVLRSRPRPPSTTSPSTVHLTGSTEPAMLVAEESGEGTRLALTWRRVRRWSPMQCTTRSCVVTERSRDCHLCGRMIGGEVPGRTVVLKTRGSWLGWP